MKISIITVCLNSEKTIEKTILSVLNQTYKQIEYIIIDGGSTDNTLKIINKYKKRISIIKSEKDRGIYYGMNKGIRLAKGHVISFLNSDDFYANKFVIEKIARTFKDKNCEGIYGDLMFIGKDYQSIEPLRSWHPGNFSLKKVLLGWQVPHPTFFVKRTYYKKFGDFDTNFKIASDSDLMTRFFLKAGLHPTYIPETLVYMRRGGSSTQLRNKIRMWMDVYRIFKKNNMKNPLVLLLTRYRIFKKSLRKIK